MTKKTVKAYAIINVDPNIDDTGGIWGTYGIEAHRLAMFSSGERAVFTKNSEEHKNEVAKGTTKIVECLITYYF